MLQRSTFSGLAANLWLERYHVRRSLQVTAPLLAATAAALLATGCHQPEPRRCVDDQNRVVDPSFCANLPQGQGQPNNYRPGFPGYLPYRYYYGGSGGFAPGAIVNGGSYAPLAGHSYSGSTATGGTTRGGFGSSFGGGGEGGGGHGGGGGE